PRLLDLLAEACERGGDLRAAAEALERARLTQPESRRLGRRLLDLYAAAGRWPEALSIQAQLLLRVRQPAALAREQQMMPGPRFLILHDRFEEAGEVLRGLPDPAAGNAFAHLLWGELHRRQGHHDQASAAFAQAAGPQLAGASSFRCAACLEPADAWQGYCPA